jgi:hypothetical protein
VVHFCGLSLVFQRERLCCQRFVPATSLHAVYSFMLYEANHLHTIYISVGCPKNGRLSTLLFSTNINQLGRNKNIIEPTIHLSYQRIDISRVPPVSPFQHLDVHHARGISLPNNPIIVSKVGLLQAYKKRKGIPTDDPTNHKSPRQIIPHVASSMAYAVHKSCTSRWLYFMDVVMRGKKRNNHPPRYSSCGYTDWTYVI